MAKKPRNYKEETPSLRESAYLCDKVLRKLMNEKVFPKRSRWLISGKIADLTNEYMAAVIEANDPKVQTTELRDRRYTLQQIAIGKLSALDVLLNQAKRSLGLPADELEDIAGQINNCRKLLSSWVASDLKRYGPPSGAVKYQG